MLQYTMRKRWSRLLLLRDVSTTVAARKIYTGLLTRKKQLQGDRRRTSHYGRRHSLEEQDDDEGFDGLFQGWGVHYVEVFVGMYTVLGSMCVGTIKIFLSVLSFSNSHWSLRPSMHAGCPNPQKQTLIVDTGSDKLGFPCAPECDPSSCGADFHLSPFYEYDNSTCFSSILCEDCEQGWCSDNSIDAFCSVGVSYAEGSSWNGFEVEDSMAVGSIDEDQSLVRFACQTSLTGLFREQLADGIVGMNKDTSSLWRQLDLDEDKFSLCFELRDYTEEQGGFMVLGGFEPQAHDLPVVYAQDVESYNRQFAVSIRELYWRVGGGTRIVPVTSNDETVRMASAGLLNGTLSARSTPIVDSGTTCTYLSSGFREPLEQAWQRVTDLPFSLSYITDASLLDQYPTLILQLRGAPSQDNPESPAMVPDYPEDIWIAFPPEHYMDCLYFESGSGVLGNNVMAGHDVIFDVDNARIGFAESRCDLSNFDVATPSTQSIQPTTIGPQSEPTNTPTAGPSFSDSPANDPLSELPSPRPSTSDTPSGSPAAPASIMNDTPSFHPPESPSMLPLALDTDSPMAATRPSESTTSSSPLKTPSLSALLLGFLLVVQSNY